MIGVFLMEHEIVLKKNRRNRFWIQLNSSDGVGIEKILIVKKLFNAK